MGMMPAFATEDANDVTATDTIDVGNLTAALERIIGDGLDVLATTGSFGEFHTLLPDEYETLVRATIEVVDDRVPLFLGCTGLNTRDVIAKMRLIAEAGGRGVLLGVPFYFPSTVDNAVQFYADVAKAFPDLAIMVYHNPPLHHVTIPVAAFERLTKIPNIVAMKDSHRTTTEFMRLDAIIGGKVSVFVSQLQYHPFAQLGARGLWSFDLWMGPAPIFALRDAVAAGDFALATEITRDIAAGPPRSADPASLSWRETAAKIAANFAGYCTPGPLRPPFSVIPELVMTLAPQRAKYWQDLCAKYPLVAASLAGQTA